MHTKLAIVFAASISGALATIPYNKNCKLDACLASAIVAKSGLAACSTYFKTTILPTPVTTTSTSVVTSTASTTVSPTVSSTTTITDTSTEYDTVTSTSSTTSTLTVTATETDTATDTFTSTTSTTTSTATVTPTNAGMGDTGANKRAAAQKGRAPSCHAPKAPPFSACNTASKYSSACSCIGAKTTTVTATTPTNTVKTTITTTSTSTITSTSTSTVSATTTVTTSNTETDVATSTITETDTTTATTTSTTTITTGTQATITTTILASPTCTSISAVDRNAGRTETYGLVYAGSNVINPNSAANNPGAPPMTTSFPGSQDVCTAAQNCANYAVNLLSDIGGEYFTFDLEFSESSQSWNCVAYFDFGSSSDFNVKNSDVKYSYGYVAQS